MDEVVFVVYGRPQQMGSKKAFVRGNRAIITDDNSAHRKQWANAVSTAAAGAMARRNVLDGAVMVRVAFHFRRPKAHYGTGRNAHLLKSAAPHWHSQTPDLDKLIRCLNDALTGVVWRDDSLVCRIEATRHWTEQQERAEVYVRRLVKQPVVIGGEQ